MADLSGRSRGQIILVAAFAMAVIFLGLAIVTNAAIYTENLATRGEGSDASDALLERDVIEIAGGDVIEAANWNNFTGGYSTIQTKVEEGIENIEDWEGHHAGLHSTFVSTQFISGSDTEGKRAYQNNSTTFTNFDSSQTNWTVAENVDGVRAFRINITSVSALQSLTGDPFRVNATNAPVGGNNWTMTIADGGAGLVTVEVERESPDRTQSCTVPDDMPLRIDVTAATVGGEACPALDIIDGDPMHIGSGVGSNYDIWFKNGDAIEGNYSLVLDAGSFPSNYGTLGGAGGQPYLVPAMYDARMQFRYHSPSVDYVTDIRLAPGEPDG